MQMQSSTLKLNTVARISDQATLYSAFVSRHAGLAELFSCCFSFCVLPDEDEVDLSPDQYPQNGADSDTLHRSQNRYMKTSSREQKNTNTDAHIWHAPLLPLSSLVNVLQGFLVVQILALFKNIKKGIHHCSAMPQTFVYKCWTLCTAENPASSNTKGDE